MFVGPIIGWERQLRHKPAGLRTHKNNTESGKRSRLQS
ncbi:MgtC/SapB family protein [Microcoleus sp. herbarium2]